jgi:hypothetical protein
MDERTGKKVFDVALAHKGRSNKVLKKADKALRNLNEEVIRRARDVYVSLASLLEKQDGRILSTPQNVQLGHTILNRLQPIQDFHLAAAMEIARDISSQLISGTREREREIQSILKKEGVEEDRLYLPTETETAILSVAQAIFEKLRKRIYAAEQKWDAFALDNFLEGISRQLTEREFLASFWTESGTIKIGSSLNGDVDGEIIMAAVAQRTALVRELAKEHGYQYCWNSNPLDRRTKPECIGATLAGVIKETEMGTDHGFPPRYICRCELVFTRGEWNTLNAGINAAIEVGRRRLIEELATAPKQLATWYIAKGSAAGTWAKSSDPNKGKKMYAEVEKKLNKAVDNEVPDWEYVAPPETPLYDLKKKPGPKDLPKTPPPPPPVPDNIDDIDDRVKEVFDQMKEIKANYPGADLSPDKWPGAYAHYKALMDEKKALVNKKIDLLKEAKEKKEKKIKDLPKAVPLAKEKVLSLSNDQLDKSIAMTKKTLDDIDELYPGTTKMPKEIEDQFDILLANQKLLKKAKKGELKPVIPTKVKALTDEDVSKLSLGEINDGLVGAQTAINKLIQEKTIKGKFPKSQLEKYQTLVNNKKKLQAAKNKSAESVGLSEVPEAVKKIDEEITDIVSVHPKLLTDPASVPAPVEKLYNDLKQQKADILGGVKKKAKPAPKKVTSPSDISKPIPTATPVDTVPDAEDYVAAPQRNTTKYLEDLEKRARKSTPLTEAQKKTTKHYCSNGYSEMNYLLREGKEKFMEKYDVSDAAVKKVMKDNNTFKKAFNKYEMPENTVLYRGVSDRVYNETKESIGTVLTDKGFSSASVEYRVAKGWKSKEIEIRVPKGTPILPPNELSPYFGAEQEIILNAGTKFKVLGEKLINERPTLVMEVIG